MKNIFLMKKRTNIKNSKFFRKRKSRLSIKTLNNNNDKNEKNKIEKKNEEIKDFGLKFKSE